MLLEQLRVRQLAREQVETYEQQRTAADKLRTLKAALALAEKQTELTNSEVEVEIAGNRGDAQPALARKQAEEAVVAAEAGGVREGRPRFGETGRAERGRLESGMN